MSPAQIDKLKDKSYKILLENRRTKGEFQYTVPSPDAYPYQWLWDSCFHAIILSHFSPRDAKEEIKSLTAKQFGNGLIPHIIYWEKKEGVIDVPWGKEDTSSITQPPILAYAVWEIYKKDKDKKFLLDIYPHLYHFYNYLLNERDPRHNHLVGIINPDESGEDDSPRFDEPLGLPPKHTLETNFAKRVDLIKKNATCNFDAPFCMKQFFWVKDVPFNSILVRNLSIMGMIAEEINRMDEALYFRDQEIHTADSMRDRMREDNLFWSLSGEEYKKIKVKTWAIFSPLFAKIIPKDEAYFLIENYLNNDEEFLDKFNVPTVSKSEPSFNPSGFWRGPVWMAVNWFIFNGLLNYGMQKEAERIREQSAKLIEQYGFRERFNPHTGQGLGAYNFTWGGLVVDMYDKM